MFEHSKWIGCTDQPPKDCADIPRSPYIARSFTLREQPAGALLHICGLGDAAYYLNGARIPDSVRPTYASYLPRHVIYNTYDVTALLRAGKNRLGAILGNLRVNHPMFAFMLPLSLIAELNITYADGTTETLCSDESFRTAPSPITFSATCCGERQDARLEIPGWCDADFDDAGWAHAVATHPDVGTLRPAQSPPKRVIAELPCRQIAPGLFDCGIVTSGHMRIKVTGRAGARIKLNYAERLLPGQMHVDRSAYWVWEYPDMYNSDEYILDGTEGKVLEQYMAYHGFRYAEVIGDYDHIEMTAVVTHTDLTPTARFTCDNAIINGIHTACVNSLRTCCQDVFVDNPKRDSPWIGDTMLSAEVILSEYDGRAVLMDNALHCRDNARPSGELPNGVPGTDIRFEKRFSGPDWGASVVFQTVWWLYRYHGDLDAFRQVRADLEKTLAFFASIADPDGYIGDPGYATGDWSCLHSRTRGRDDIMSNAYYRWDAQIMAELSAQCGCDRTQYDALAQRIRDAFRARYMPDGVFEETSVSELIVLAARGFFDPEELPEILSRIVRSIERDGNLITFGVHGIRMLPELLCSHGYGPFLFDVLLNPNGPGYARSVLRGLQTLPERFDYDDYEGSAMMSLNHHFFGTIDTFFYRRLAGIQFNDRRSGDMVIDPLFVRGINTLSAEFCGIRVSYDADVLRVESPCAFTLHRNGARTQHGPGAYAFPRA